MEYIAVLFLLFSSLFILRKIFYKKYKEGVIGSGDLIIAHILGVPIITISFYAIGGLVWKVSSQMLRWFLASYLGF